MNIKYYNSLKEKQVEVLEEMLKGATDQQYDAIAEFCADWFTSGAMYGMKAFAKAAVLGIAAGTVAALGYNAYKTRKQNKELKQMLTDFSETKNI